MSTTLSLFHLVFCTYRRRMTINLDNEEALYRFIWKLLTERKCKLLRINGTPNHIHIFVDIHSSIPLAKLAGEIKRISSLWMKQSNLFPEFEKWGKEFFGFSKSVNEKNFVINYIKNQKAHHHCISFEDEIKSLVNEEGIEWDGRMMD